MLRINPAFFRHPEDAAIIGRLVVAFGELEYLMSVLSAWSTAQPNDLMRVLYFINATSSRIAACDSLLRPTCLSLDLIEEYEAMYSALWWCLTAWKASTQPAWFFVDSVDEAKLASVPLDTALRRLSDGIDGAEGRAHIVISGRYTDWEVRADLASFNALLPIPVKRSPPEPPSTDALLVRTLRRDRVSTVEEEKQAEPPLIVIMAPLDEDRVRRFAISQGVSKLNKFMAAIDSGNLWRFARRPLDLQWLVTYWQQNGRFSSLQAMLQASLNERLREPNPRHALNDRLALDRAIGALERIGATFVFGRTDKLAIPDSELSLAPTSSDFDLAKIMPDWSADRRRRLLTRAVFDPATFGRVRLHNDNEGVVRGYLAARWLLHRRQANCPLPTLLDLLFADTYGISLIKPSVQETAAWLAIWDTDVAREVVRRAPEVLLTEGDPSSLSLTVSSAGCEMNVKFRTGLRQSWTVAKCEPIRWNANRTSSMRRNQISG